MGRKSKLTDAQWEKLKHHNWFEIATEFLASKDDEKVLTTLLKMHLIFGNLERILGVSKIHRYRFEFNVKVGRVDLVLFHFDGGVSLVEVKSGDELRNVVGGIGQLCLYEHAFKNTTRRSTTFTYLNKILLASMKPEKSLPVIAACEISGVKFVHYATHMEIATERIKLKQELTKNGA